MYGKSEILVLLKINDIYYSIIASEDRSLFQWPINNVRGEQDMMDVEVSSAYVTTQGVSPSRDVD